MLKKIEVYSVIDEELEYAESYWNEQRNKIHRGDVGYQYYEGQPDSEKSVETWICWMEEYLHKARTAATHSENKIEALNNIRKAIALGVTCMMHKGAPSRFNLK